MDFAPTGGQARIRELARAYADEVVAPLAARIERDEAIPAELFRGLGERGLMGVAQSVADGGAGEGAVAYSLAMMEIARACASTAVTMAVTNMVGEVIAKYGSEAQRRRFIPVLCKGETGAFALSEPGAGSDPGAMLTTARRDGDGWVVNGTKQWISHGDISRVLVLWARTGGAGPRGLSCFLVPGGSPGLTVARLEEKMGLRGSHTVGLAMEEMRLPGDALLGEEGAGFAVAMTALDGGRIGIASQAIGIAEAASAVAVESARGRGPAIEQAQGVQWRIADGRTELDAARLLTLRAAALKERGEPFTREASMAKLFATEAAWRTVNRAVEALGEEGGSPAASVERWLRDVRVTRLYEGTSEVQRIVISRAVLRGS